MGAATMSTMPRAKVAAGWFLLAPLAFAAGTPFDQAFDRLYNFDFAGAHALLDAYIARHPGESLPYAMRGSAYLFRELDRLGILEGEFFSDDKRIIDRKKLKPDPVIRAKFLKAVEDAQSRATGALAANPDDRDALFTMCVTQGITTDYMALVEKRQIASLSTARQSNDFAQRLLRLDPNYYDAYLTTGLSEYLVGSLPFFIRWFVHFDNISGSKEKGVTTLLRVAREGHYLKPFAKILLSIAYLRDKKPWQSRQLLAELSRQYPSNPLFRKELGKLESQMGGSAN
jgi:hypothetical protein